VLARLAADVVSADKAAMTNAETSDLPPPAKPAAAIIGAGPAGLIAAERLAAAGAAVTVYDRMPSPGRKWLMAGRGGLNLTHSEPLAPFMSRFGEAAASLLPSIERFPPEALRAWSEGLGEPTFVGSSGRVFPKSLKASPLLRALLRRLADLGVAFELRQEWLGFDEGGANRFRGPDGVEHAVAAEATLLALGGASWPRLGSNGAWTEPLAAAGVAIRPLLPANVGFEIGWTAPFRERFAGEPLKAIAIRFGERTQRGEAMLTDYGIEGGAIYALSGPLRDAIAAEGSAMIRLDLRPDMAEAEIAARIARQPASQSLSNRLRKALRLSPAGINLLREAAGASLPREPEALAALLKALPLRLAGTRGIERAISSAGGIAFAALDDHLMLRALPGVFAAGEMLDWEAPTGGYLLQASFSTGLAAADGMIERLGLTPPLSA